MSVSSIQICRPFTDFASCCEFEIKIASGRVYVFKAETSTTCAGWMNAIQSAKHTDAIVQSELETVRIRSVTSPRIIAFDKLGSNDDLRSKQAQSELKCMFVPECGPEQIIAATQQCISFLLDVDKDCLADPSVGR